MQTNTIKRHVGSLELLDEIEHRGQLRPGIFDIVVVDVELRIRVCGAGGIERDLNVLCAEGVVEDVRAPGTVIVERFVDNVPRV